MLDRHYRVLKRLAIGGAGVTYLAQELGDQDDLVGDKLAIKVLYAQRDQGSYLQRLSTEAQILLQLNHPHIVDIRGFVQRAGHSPYLVTRFESGGSLLDHLRRVGAMDLDEIVAMGVSLCSALAQAHKQGVIHRDLKPENILLTHQPGRGEVPNIKLTDFGIAKVHGGLTTNLTRVGAFVGTPQFAAPEQFQGMPLSPSADVYSVGAVLLFCRTLRPVLGEIDMAHPDRMYTQLMEGLPPALGGEGADPQITGFNTFLRATMAPNPAQRVSIDEAMAMLGDLVAGRPVHAPADLGRSSRTVVPDALAALETDESLHGAPSGDDTFEGILSQDGGKTKVGTAAHPQAARQPDAQGSGLTELDSEPPPEPTPPAPAEASGGSGRSRWVAGLLAFLLVILCGGGVPVAAWWESPSNIPGVVWDLFPPPQALASDSKHAAELRQSLVANRPRMTAGCKGSGLVRFNLTLEGNGKVRRITELESTDPTLARCVAKNTLELQFDRRAPRAGILAVELEI